MKMMKRILALALLAALCLSLVACGGEPEPGKEIVGTWADANGNTLRFNDDGTGTMPGTGGNVSINWRYSAAAKVFEVDAQTKTYQVNPVNNDGKWTLEFNGVTYTKK